MKNIPLFPLQQPLYPGIPLDLRIFEQRYLNLVTRSLKNAEPFGIVPIISGREVGAPPDIYPWGTLVEIRDWNQLEGGLLGIRVQGDRRLHVRETAVQHDGLLTASVDILPADEFVPVPEEYGDLLQLLEELAEKLPLDYLKPDGNTGAAELGWRLTMLLPLATEKRLSMLEVDDSLERLDRLRDWLAAMANG